MSAPLILFGLSALTVSLAFFSRNAVRTASFVGFFGTLVSAAFVLLAPIDKAIEVGGLSFKLEPFFQVLGRALVLDGATQPMVGFLYLTGCFLLLPSWLAGGSRYFPTLAVVMLAVTAAALMAVPFLYAAIFIEFSAIGGGLILVSRRTPQNLGALRLLTLYTLALLIILITGAILDQGNITSATTEVAERTTLLFIFGVAVLILVPPFHIWFVNASQEANPYALAFVVLILQSAALFLLFRFLDAYPWLRESTLAFQAIRVGGVLCLLVGVLFAASQRDLRKVLAYMIVADIGFTMFAIASSTPTGFRLALGMTASRTVSLGVFSLGLSMLELNGTRSPAEKASSQPAGLTRLFVLAGMLSLAGFPLTAGFPGRWSLLTVLLGANTPSTYLVLGAYFALSLLAFWWGYKLLGRQHDLIWIGARLESFYLIAGIGIILLLGIFPQLTYPWVADLADGLSRLFG